MQNLHHLTTLLVYIFATKACIDNRKNNLLDSNISSTCPHNMVNCRSLTAEFGSGVWSTPANFNGFRVSASLLHQRRSTEVNQNLYDAWPSRALLLRRGNFTGQGGHPVGHWAVELSSYGRPM